MGDTQTRGVNMNFLIMALMVTAIILGLAITFAVIVEATKSLNDIY